MDQFQHVMVLASIIIGLAIANLLTAAGAVIDRLSERDQRLRLSLTHAVWSCGVFVWLVSFWWWQFRLLELVTTWTLGRYLYIILYAVLLFMLVVILVPRDWDEVSSLDDYFMSRRAWFFSFFFATNVVDVGDSYLKGGWDYIRDAGTPTLALLLATVPVTILGIRSTDMRVQRAMAVGMVAWQMLVIFDAFPHL